MRVMIIDPGFDYSTLAVAENYCKAFEECGYEVVEYDTKKSLEIAKRGGIENFYAMTEYAMSPIVNQVITDDIGVVLMVHGFWMNPSIVISLRNLGCKVGLILTDDPMQLDKSLEWSRYYEFIFTNDRNTVSFYGDKGHYLPVAVNPKIFKPQKVEERFKSEILIGGSFYKERIALIEKIAGTLLKYDTCLVGSKKINFTTESLEKLVKANKISYEEMAKYVAGADLVLDIPRDEFGCRVFGDSNTRRIKASCLSPRIFECFASGVFVYTSNQRNDLQTLYPDFEIPVWETYKDIEDTLRSNHKLVDNIFLNDLQRWTLAHHTYINRVKEIESIMNIKPSIKTVRPDGIPNVQVNKRWEEQWENNFNYCMINHLYTNKKSASIEHLKQIGFSTDSVDIISNGPSLEKYVVQFRSNTRKMFLNDAIKYRVPLDNHIDYAVAIHPDEDIYRRCYLDKFLNLNNIDLICSTLVYPYVIEYFRAQNRGVWFFNTGKESDSEESIKAKVRNETKWPVLAPGLTVGYSAICVALYLGFKNINVYGLDFCYTDNKRYAFEDFTFDKIDNKQMTIVPNARNRPVMSDYVMIKCKDMILKLIESNPDVNFKVYGDGLLYSKNLKNLTVG